MRKMLLFVVLSVSALVLAICPAFAAAKIIKNVRITDGRKKLYFDLFQSSVEPAMWYCGQTRPEVLMRQTGDLEIPEISIIRYQKKDVKNPQKLVEGAHFRMQLSLGPSEEILEELKSKIPKQSDGRPILLSPVPFGALKLCLQKPDGQEVRLLAEPLSGISRQHSSQNVAFSTNLDVLDTDILDALMKGSTGAKYSLYYNYQYLDPVLTGKMPSSISGGRDLLGSGSEKIGDSRDLPGQRDFDVIEKQAEAEAGWERAGQGFIGFGKYSKAVQDKCVFIEKNADGWENAYMAFPAIIMPTGIKIGKIELEVALMHNKKAYDEQKFTWTPAKSWRDKYGAPIVYGVFDISGLRQKSPEDLDSVYFAVKQRIESNDGDVLAGEGKFDMIEGDSPISDPLDIAQILELQTGFLTWSDGTKNGVKRIEVELSEGDWKASRTIEPRSENGRVIQPESALWLISRNRQTAGVPLVANLNFIVSSGSSEKKIPWALNGKDLRTELFSLSAILFDKDWSVK